MATKRAHRKPEGNHSALYPLMSFLVAVGAAALALGPDSWMEWLMLGVTLISAQAMKVILAVVAGAILVRLMWPFMSQAASKPR